MRRALETKLHVYRQGTGAKPPKKFTVFGTKSHHFLPKIKKVDYSCNFAARKLMEWYYPLGNFFQYLSYKVETKIEGVVAILDVQKYNLK